MCAQCVTVSWFKTQKYEKSQYSDHTKPRNVLYCERLSKVATARGVCQKIFQQECIPVGCVPSATVAVCCGGVYLVPGGVPAWGVYLVPGGFSWSRGCTWSRGVYLILGGGCTWSGGYLSRYPPPAPPLWTEWLADRCKNITFATSLWMVNMFLHREFTTNTGKV